MSKSGIRAKNKLSALLAERMLYRTVKATPYHKVQKIAKKAVTTYLIGWVILNR